MYFGVNADPSSAQEPATEPGQEVVMDCSVNPAEDIISEQVDLSPSSERWSTYQSPLQSYPFSRWHLHLTGPSDVVNGPIVSGTGDQTILTPSGSFSTNSAGGSVPAHPKDATMTDNLLRSLKMATLFKNLDPERRICRFEIPGGGACRDDKCEDLHIDKELETLEPSDDDTAQYVSEAFPTSKRDQQPRTATEVKNALREIRMRQETKELGFEDRVSAALSMLGVLGH